ncbi:MAG: TetR/AcrR family transcriptional regulator [Actinomycetaceae bacterium]|nr:TetR/AcrR family transcriptional regulator [Actinomycetaceae bacterium]
MPKIIGDTLTDHRELTRRKLFDALADLMALRPFDTITMSEIAKVAGVGRTAVYNHFADKEVLLLAFMEQATREFSEHVNAALAGHDDPIDQLRIYLRAHLEMTDRYHLTSGVNLRHHLSQQTSEHLHDHAGTVGALLGTILVRAIEAGRIPAQDPRTLVGLIHASLAGQRLPEHHAQREVRIATATAFVLRGIGVSGDLAPIPMPGRINEGGAGHISHSADTGRGARQDGRIAAGAGAYSTTATGTSQQENAELARETRTAPPRASLPHSSEDAFLRCPVHH